MCPRARADEVLQRAQRLRLGVGVDELRVDLGVLDLLAHHQQVLGQVVVLPGLHTRCEKEGDGGSAEATACVHFGGKG